jgi:signal transduction histidine kinase
LAGTKLYLGMAGKDKEMKELIKYPMELIDTAIQEIRSLSSKNVTPLKDVKLNELLELLIDDLNKNTKIKSVFIYDIKMEDISDDLKLNIYRVIQEQINNIVKHAKPENVSVSVQAKNKIIHVTVTDDGKGFDMKKKRTGIGISNMMNRVESFNGKMRITSSPGKGCTTEITVPY